MLTDLIAQYLTAHKRLVVPQLGAFIVKEPDHTVLFSELLRRDDGVLRQVLRDAGMAELEAAGEIDRFVFEVRHAVEHGGTYRMRGFGQMAPGPNGTIAFHYDPQLDVAPQPAAPSAAEESARAAPAVSARAHSDDGNGGEEGGKSRHHAPLRPDKVAEAVKAAFAETRISPSAKMNPDPSLRGLRYGMPP